MADTRPIIATVRGTREQQRLFKEVADKSGISLNEFMLASALARLAMSDSIDNLLAMAAEVSDNAVDSQ